MGDRRDRRAQPAVIGDDFLVVSAVIDYNDIYIPVTEGFTKLALVFAGIMAAILSNNLLTPIMGYAELMMMEVSKKFRFI